MICDKDHTLDVPRETLASLPESQKLAVRHRCVGCAYLAGYRAGYLQAMREVKAQLESLKGRVEGGQ